MGPAAAVTRPITPTATGVATIQALLDAGADPDDVWFSAKQTNRGRVARPPNGRLRHAVAHPA